MTALPSHTPSFTDALVVMATSTDSVIEGMGYIVICVNPGICGIVETALTVTLTAIEGKASKWTLDLIGG